MGLSIHYHGKLNKAPELKSMIDEVAEVAIANKWKYFVFEDTFENNSFSDTIDPENLFGIMVTPENSEPFCYSFLSNGRMCGLINFKVMQIDGDINEDLTYAVSTKTQYAGHETHIKIILLLDYISKKYLTNFECYDEGEYWEKRDENVLIQNFNRFTSFINGFTSSMEMNPINEAEDINDYLNRIAALTKENNKMKEEGHNDELPKLNIEQENEFKRLKLSLEHDAIFPEFMKSTLPPEIESQFLDNILNFENSIKNAKPISVYEKIGKPKFKAAHLLNEEEITIELDRIDTILNNHNLSVDVICDYEDEKRLIYTFITKDLFEHKIDDLNIDGWVTHFTYEDFYPNDLYDIENKCTDFIEIFLDKKNSSYKKHHSKEASNHEALNNFRGLFKKFKIKQYQFDSATIDQDNAKAVFNIDFWGKIKGTETKMFYSGEGEITFNREYGYWCVQNVNLPIMN